MLARPAVTIDAFTEHPGSRLGLVSVTELGTRWSHCLTGHRQGCMHGACA